jgi:hypothetical protein
VLAATYAHDENGPSALCRVLVPVRHLHPPLIGSPSHRPDLEVPLRVLIDKALAVRGYVLLPLAAPHHRRDGLVFGRPSTKGQAIGGPLPAAVEATTACPMSDGALLRRLTAECDCRLSRVPGRNDGACSGVRKHGFDYVVQMFWPAAAFWLASPFMTSCPLTASWRAAQAGPGPPAAPWAGRSTRALRSAWSLGSPGPGLALRVPLRGSHPQDRRRVTSAISVREERPPRSS